jgi:hypothetical protein
MKLAKTSYSPNFLPALILVKKLPMLRLIVLASVLSVLTVCAQAQWTPWETIYSETIQGRVVRVQISFKVTTCINGSIKGYSFYRTNNEFNREDTYLDAKFAYTDCAGKAGIESYKVDMSKPGINQSVGLWFLGKQVNRTYFDVKYTSYARKPVASANKPASSGSGASSPIPREVSYPSKQQLEEKRRQEEQRKLEEQRKKQEEQRKLQEQKKTAELNAIAERAKRQEEGQYNAYKKVAGDANDLFNTIGNHAAQKRQAEVDAVAREQDRERDYARQQQREQRTETCSLCDGSGESECNYCDGKGSEECSPCNGTGETSCGGCFGTGSYLNNTCVWCKGSGRNTCTTCNGEGSKSCYMCGGRGHENCSRCSGTGTTVVPDYSSSSGLDVSSSSSYAADDEAEAESTPEPSAVSGQAPVNVVEYRQEAIDALNKGDFTRALNICFDITDNHAGDIIYKDYMIRIIAYEGLNQNLSALGEYALLLEKIRDDYSHNRADSYPNSEILHQLHYWIFRNGLVWVKLDKMAEAAAVFESMDSLPAHACFFSDKYYDYWALAAFKAYTRKQFSIAIEFAGKLNNKTWSKLLKVKSYQQMGKKQEALAELGEPVPADTWYIYLTELRKIILAMK